ncbi:hypothetical protein CSW59_06910 [Caulobacter sp. BP25]|nr:hypothetical protein CSW59_06910 [Caulobacter sp. BP25]
MVRDYNALVAYIAARMRAPFAWGENDCVTFAAGAVKAQTGRDPLGAIAARWTTARGAALVLRRLGGMEAAVSSVLAPIAPAMAARGDVAGWMDPQGRLQLAIVEGSTLVGPGEAGLVRLPRASMVKAWSAA